MTASARELARSAHTGQNDRAGRDYYRAHLTPIAQAAAVFGSDAEDAGWLHDVLEDTETTADRLTEQGISPDVISAVESVTRRADESYEEMIDRACAHQLGRLVKLVDNAWNITSNPVLVALEPEKAATMLRERYLPARDRLLAAAGLHLDSPEVVKFQTTLDRHHAHLNHAWTTGDNVPGKPQVTDFRRRARLQQTNHRLASGSSPGTYLGAPRGPVFDTDWLLEHPGANFLSEAIHRSVLARLEAAQDYETLDNDRLQRHLLSSMPLCFNLFGELASQRERLSDFGSRLFDQRAQGEDVRFEWSPGRRSPSFTGDRTAFDVAMTFDSPGGGLVVGIETKYHEWAQAEKPPHPAKRLPRYREIVEAGLEGRKVFKEDWEDRILGKPTQQIWRDHLLLLSMLQHDPDTWRQGKYILVYPEKNPSFACAAEHYRAALEDDSTFMTMTIEQVLDAGVLTVATEAKFRARYLW